MYKLAIKSQVWVELQNMIDFYERKSTGLGNRFLKDFDDTLFRLSNNPYSYFNLKNNKRRISLKVFQSMIVFEIKEDVIEVLALSDFRSKPSKNI